MRTFAHLKDHRLARPGLTPAITTALLVSLSLGACAKKPSAPQRESVIPVAVEVPRLTAAEDTAITYPVVIGRDREANLSFRVAGSIEALPVRIGERVASGAMVARLNATPYHAARVRADEDVARLVRASARSRALVPAGAAAPSADEDNNSALQAARAALANAAYDEASAVARAPFSGIVLARQAEVGETVSAGQGVVRLADLQSALIARASVPQDVAQRLIIGATAQVNIEGRAPIAAVVRHIGAAADPKTGTIGIELTLPQGMDLPSGVTGSVLFRQASTVNVQRISAEALLDGDQGRGHVFVVDAASRAHRVEVSLDGLDGDALKVSGLTPEARVITSGAGFVRDGQTVAVTRQ